MYDPTQLAFQALEQNDVEFLSLLLSPGAHFDNRKHSLLQQKEKYNWILNKCDWEHRILTKIKSILEIYKKSKNMNINQLHSKLQEAFSAWTSLQNQQPQKKDGENPLSRFKEQITNRTCCITEEGEVIYLRSPGEHLGHSLMQAQATLLAYMTSKLLDTISLTIKKCSLTSRKNILNCLDSIPFLLKEIEKSEEEASQHTVKIQHQIASMDNEESERLLRKRSGAFLVVEQRQGWLLYDLTNNYISQKKTEGVDSKLSGFISKFLKKDLESLKEHIFKCLEIESERGKAAISYLLQRLDNDQISEEDAIIACLEQQAIEHIAHDLAYENLPIETENDKGQTLLEIALRLKQFDVVALLAKRGCSFNKLLFPESKESLFLKCIQTHHPDIVPFLISSGGIELTEETLKEKDNNDNTLLHQVLLKIHDLSSSYSSVCSQSPNLLRKGEVGFFKSYTKAYYAYEPPQEVLRLMSQLYTVVATIARSCSYVVWVEPNKKKQTPLDILLMIGVTDINDSSYEALILSLQETISHLMTDLLHLLLITAQLTEKLWQLLYAQKADLTAFCRLTCTYEGNTALHIAAATENHLACKWLLATGVDINLLDKNGKTPLDKASRCYQTHTLSYLEEQGARHGERIEGFTQQLHQLLNKEDITTDPNSIPPSDWEIFNKLVRQGADLNGLNTLSSIKLERCRPLHTAVLKGNQRLIEWLIGKGADLSLTDKEWDETPFQRLERITQAQQVTAAWLKQRYLPSPNIEEKHAYLDVKEKNVSLSF